MRSNICYSFFQEPSLGLCTALYPYPGESEGDLPFPQDAQITILEYVDDDWMRGEYNGKSGLFPKPFVRIDSESGNSLPYRCDLNIAEAFDKVVHSELFQNLLI